MTTPNLDSSSKLLEEVLNNTKPPEKARVPVSTPTIVEKIGADAPPKVPLPVAPVPAPPQPRTPPPYRRILADREGLKKMRAWYEEIKRDWLPVIHEMGFPPGSDGAKSGVILLMGFVTQDSRHIARVTGWNSEWVKQCRQRAIDNHLWKGRGTIRADWLTAAMDPNEKDGVAEIALTMAIMAVNGDAIGTKDGRWCLSPKGLAMARDLKDDPLPPKYRKKPDLDRFKDDGNPNGE